jgi:cysteine desulfurase
MTERIYLDHNATTPTAPEVTEAMEPFLADDWGNPSSVHWAGAPARDAVERARSQVAALLACDATEIVFTSGGTEANNHAIKGIFFARATKIPHPHIITSQIEHPAVLEPCRFVEQLGARVTRLPVDGEGLVSPDDVRRAIRPTTVLISIMHANNEVGTIEPIEEIAQIAREHDVLCHTDAAQSVGKITVDVESLGVDLLSVAGHKVYAPKGVGALVVREGVDLEPLLHGASQEAGRRAGTENVASIVGFGAACQVARHLVDDPEIRRRRDRFWHALQAGFGQRIVLNGAAEPRLPNTLNASFVGHVGDDILARLPQLAASTGAACHAGHTQISPVLAAMGIANDVATGAIRFSLGRDTTDEQISAVVTMLARVCRAAQTTDHQANQIARRGFRQ